MTKVAIQGFTGSFHAIAAEKMLGTNIELVMCDSFPNLFKSLEQGIADCAVMAIENTIAGSILFNYALLHQYDSYQIAGETSLRIEHFLMALPGQNIDQITEVRSHPMAIMQCMAFFRKHPQIKLVEDIDTAYMAELIAKNRTKGIAAIAGKHVASTFGLEVLQPNIEDSTQNFTRFLYLKKGPQTAEVGANKTLVSFTISNTKGQLRRIFDVFADNQINVANIQSLPLVGNEWQYRFFCDLEFESDPKAINELIQQLNTSYPITIRSYGYYKKGI